MQSLTARPAVASVKLPGVRRRQLRCNAAAEKEGTVYVGKGKFIVDKKGLAARTGGFAGGETGLWNFREEIKKGGENQSKKSTSVDKKGSSDISLAKDFGAMAGGFPGGEVGVKLFNATGEVPKPSKAPTLGAGPPVLGALLVGYAGLSLLTGELDPREWSAAFEPEDSPSAQSAGAEGASMAAMAPARPAKPLKAPRVKVDVKAIAGEAQLLAPAAPYLALGAGVLAGGIAAKTALSGLVGKVARSARVALVGGVATLVAAKILQIL